MSSGRWMGLPASSSRRHVSTWSGSNNESPTGKPCAPRNVKHMPPPMTSESTTPSKASITPILSLTLAPPSTATNGRLGWSRRPSSTSTSLASSRPAALGRVAGGPTIDAWARWQAPKASST